MSLTKTISAAVALLAASSAPLLAEDSALLKILVRKGVLTEKEALSIEAESQQEKAKEKAASNVSALRLSESLTELKLYGDVRLRYQYENKDNQVDPITGLGFDRSPSGQQRSRWRFRLRLNADFKLGTDWFGGVELQTGYASDSANQSFENGFADYPIFISKAYIGYNAAEWLQLVGGKQPNPFYTTDLVWDPDINPSGLVERFSLTKLWGSKSSGGSGFAKDGKTLLEAVAPESPWDVSIVAGQFIFDDNLEGGGRDPGALDNDVTSDVYLFETQLIASYKFNKDTKLTIAPAWLKYTGGTVARSAALSDAFGDFNENSFVDSAFVSGAQRHLNIIQAPGDISFKLFGVKTKVFWDFAYNIEGKSRAEDIYQLVATTQDLQGRTHRKSQYSPEDSFAWMVGFQLGENKKKGDLSFLANYRRTGIAAVDPNLNDNDFALGELNTQGFRLSLAYSLANFSEFRVTYMPAWNLDKNLTLGEATNNNAVADGNAIQTLQVDLTVKF